MQRHSRTSTDNANTNPEREWFGDTHVDPMEKTRKVLGVFSSVASKYDLMNDLMSGGIHRLWKDRFVTRLRVKPDERVLDLAGGTGDIATRILKTTRNRARVTVCDINEDMLRAGRDRQINRGVLDAPDWVVGNAESLPFADSTFDVATIAFGLRNVTHIDTALADIRRVLKPGGRFFCLEFSPVQQPLVQSIYRPFSDLVIPKLGALVAKDQGSYAYLVESIRRFPEPQNLCDRMEKAGFTNVGYTRLTYGIACIHHGFA